MAVAIALVMVGLVSAVAQAADSASVRLFGRVARVCELHFKPYPAQHRRNGPRHAWVIVGSAEQSCNAAHTVVLTYGGDHPLRIRYGDGPIQEISAGVIEIASHDGPYRGRRELAVLDPTGADGDVTLSIVIIPR